jgi:hypothetical protein
MVEPSVESPSQRDVTLALLLAGLGTLAVLLSLVSFFRGRSFGGVLPSLGIGAGVACNGISTLLSVRAPKAARVVFYLQYPLLLVGIVAAVVNLAT